LKLDRSYWIRTLSAHGLLSATDYAFDNWIYPAVLIWLGVINGCVVMTMASMVLCAGFLAVYERMKIDWLGVNALEVVKEHGQSWVRRLDAANILIRVFAWIPTRIFLVVLWAVKKNDLLAFLAFSLYEDAFKTTAFLRKGKFGRFGRKDVGIFFASLVISNLYWTVRWTVIIGIIKRIYHWVMT